MMNPFLLKLQLSEDDKNKNITTKALFLIIVVYKRLALSSSLLVKCCNRSKHWSSLSSFLSLSLSSRDDDIKRRDSARFILLLRDFHGGRRFESG